jgi:tetraacyldisaccharide 4'-kinase
VHQVNIEGDTAELVGDEALLLAAYAPVWVGGTRYQRAQAAIKAGAELLITDDGWQDPALAKDYILAVLDDEYPFGNGWRLPLGPLRQSPLMLQQADQIIRVGNDYQNLERGRDTLNAITVRRSSYWSSQPQAVRQAIIFCGIGQAGQFFAAARALCDQSHITVVDCVRFPDHHLFTSEELSALQQKCSEAALVTTRKDWYRLSAKWLSRVNVIDLRLVWETDQQPADLVKQLMNLRP